MTHGAAAGGAPDLRRLAVVGASSVGVVIVVGLLVGLVAAVVILSNVISAIAAGASICR